MEFFQLFALGADFDAQGYARRSDLAWDEVWTRNEPGACHDHSGVRMHLRGGDDVSFREQDDWAATFLERNQSALAALACEPGVTSLTLGLHFREAFARNLVSFVVTPSTRLLVAAVKASVSLALYVEVGGEIREAISRLGQ